MAAFGMEDETTHPTTPPRGSVAVDLDKVRANISSLTLTPSTVAPSTSSQSLRRSARGKPRKLFSSPPVFTELATSGGVLSANGTASDRHIRQPWSTDEVRALISFLLLYSEGSLWPSHASKQDLFWKKAGQYVQNQVQSEYCRSGQSQCVSCMYVGYICTSHVHCI